MEEQVRHFCESLIARLEGEFSGFVTDVHIVYDRDRRVLVASDDEGEPYAQSQMDFPDGTTPENARPDLEKALKDAFEAQREQLENLPLQKPYDIVFGFLGTESEENLLTVDSDLIFLDSELMAGLSSDLDAFWESLSKE